MDFHFSSSDDSGMEGDDEVSDESDDDEQGAQPHPMPPSHLGRYVQHAIDAMYEKCYEQPRDKLPWAAGFLSHVLDVLKTAQPEKFHENLCVSPHTFNKIVAALEKDPVFQNNSDNKQMPVEQQVAITLYRFGNDGNSASLQQVANWSGVAKGTVGLVTQHVMTAILHPDFMGEAVHYPTPEEKEAAKRWHDSWCLVDGMLSYFDQKSNYSLNVQIVSLPNLQIIDFGYRYTGSTHDSTAWEATRIVQEHESVFEDDEFIWADSAYLIWSEHAIGYLKGRFHSLKGLHVSISDEASHKFATYWVVACIGLHAFALRSEQEERAYPFNAEGLSSSSDSEVNALCTQQRRGGTHLQAAKACCEELKHALFCAKDTCTRHWA
ncbi:hypothetical protein NEOLEDRAFT_1156052 [Neolentinus lepideus HHB14362 ss-1]|uniref:DDE Tnp4 domain-containing protein n=1 Tax=Neolentinus lepideus HHB14362 ss-1 TaxID=1314782 RepID=A0A165SZQ8_9AGAM|nr:hypothetical protein NEOLEDRAFT_1156052 [Neolentinus lepideus HHB14362 ss-1]